MRKAVPTLRGVTSALRGTLVVRFLAVLIALQSNGLVHEGMEWFLGDAVEHPECADDDECPPGCADCTCVHSARPAVPHHASAAELPAITDLAYGFAAPVEPGDDVTLRGVFHPPRA